MSFSEEDVQLINIEVSEMLHERSHQRVSVFKKVPYLLFPYLYLLFQRRIWVTDQ